ncbi:hypothetical protein GALMADRAFT_244705 [Galerina marginata CBS 339.88]|uniref:FAD-binding domain-containing protein n=1 Tax=Galerina marginata (strain CBS 339.88) TaxID=685588 RepID=A0A067TGH3_GALM3|nr:hypothetical protein GALMADRAFT_244705 [Galerina marginata CBS 339.88]
MPRSQKVSQLESTLNTTVCKRVISLPSACPMSIVEILIVGAGPSGLILALSLARHGVPVRVIEKTKTHRIGQRGAGIQPRSLETFEALGIIDEVRKRAINPSTLCMYKMPDGVELLKEIPLIPKLNPDPSTPYMHAVMLGQDSLDKIVRAELEKHGVVVELGTELQSLTQFDDYVDVKILRHNLDENSASEPVVEEASYKWVVGADGGKGIVRKQLGLALLGDTTEQNFVVGDIKLKGLNPERWHMWGDFANTITTIRPTEISGLYWFCIGGAKFGDPAKAIASQDAVHTYLKKGTGKKSEDIMFGEVVCMDKYTINIRMVDTFQKGRVFLIGDAGHVHSPTGGQGLNTGVQDAFNLAWKLALVTKAIASPKLLETYNEERLPVVSEMLNITTTLLKKTIANEGGPGWNRDGNLRQLGVNYRWSTIVVDEEEEASGVDQAMGSAYDVQAGFVRAGDRAPDAPGLIRVGRQSREDPIRLFKLLSLESHTILVFRDKVDCNSVLAKLDEFPKDLVHPIVIVKAGEGSSILGDVFEDREGHAHKAYKGAEGTTGIFVVRPDGVVGCRAGSTHALERYFQGVFEKSPWASGCHNP